MDTIKKLLTNEAASIGYKLDDKVIDKFVSLLTEIELETYEPLVAYGELDDNIYVIKSGILRYAYFDGLNERTFAFATPGTVVISFHSYVMHQPSFLQLEACTNAVILKISKRKFNELIDSSHEFAKWMLHFAYGQLWAFEMKLQVVNGTAKERFESLIKNRPEILEQVALKIIASYLGITPQYLSRLKKKLGSYF